MLKAIIVDDELKSREVIEALLKRVCPIVTVVAQADNIIAAHEEIIKHKPDIVFLDVEMPYGNGFDLLQKFKEINFEVVFITAYDQYAMKAIRFAALDYLLKPVDEKELAEAVQKATVQLQHKNQQQLVELLLKNMEQNKTMNRIALPTLNGLRIIDFDSIVYLSADGNYTNFHLLDKETITICRTLKEYEDLLDSNTFFRSHHSYLINLKHVKEYRKGRGGFLIMKTGNQIDVSQRKRDELLEKLML